MPRRVLKTHDDVKAQIAGAGWRITYDRKVDGDASSQTRMIEVQRDFPYEDSDTRKKEWALEQELLKLLGVKGRDTLMDEWTNEDGGPQNHCLMQFYIDVQPKQRKAA